MNTDLIQGVKASYLRAFAQVAKILVPTLEITEIKADTIINLTEGSRSHEVVITGFDDIGYKVEVSRDDCGNIVVKYMHCETREIFRTKKVWFYAFNWQGLMATEK